MTRKNKMHKTIWLSKKNIDYDVNVGRQKMTNILDGPGCL